MEKNRCKWAESHELLRVYHDEEWGVPVRDDSKLFEFLVLDAFQAGLSWLTILKKRENFRKAFGNFDYKQIAKYSEKKVEELLRDEGIIRNKLKVKATITNAQAFMEVQKEFGTFNKYIWQFVEGKTIQNKCKTWKDVPVTSEISDAISKDLKKRGFKFVGSTIIYAFTQAAGLINDHEISCFRFSEIDFFNKRSL